MENEIELLRRWRRGDRQAGSRLFRAHFRSVYRFFRNKVGAAADELTQETFLACAEHAQRIREGSRFRPYLFGIAHNKLLMYFRRYARGGDPLQLASASLMDPGTSPSRRPVRQREAQHVLEALQRIPLGLQTVIELHYWEDLSVQEIATTLDIAPGTVKSRLSRGRDALERALERIIPSQELLQETSVALDRWARSAGEGLLLPPDREA